MRIAIPVLAAAVMAVGAPVGAATPLEKAVADYNALPGARVPLALASPQVAVAPKGIPVGQWLDKPELTGAEAAALAAVFGVYRGRYLGSPAPARWSTAEYAAGVAAGLAVQATRSYQERSRGVAFDFDTQPKPNPAETGRRRLVLMMALSDMKTCSGALVRLARSLTAQRPSADETQMVLRAQRELGANALPPDNSCVG